MTKPKKTSKKPETLDSSQESELFNQKNEVYAGEGDSALEKLEDKSEIEFARTNLSFLAREVVDTNTREEIDDLIKNEKFGKAIDILSNEEKLKLRLDRLDRFRNIYQRWGGGNSSISDPLERFDDYIDEFIIEEENENGKATYRIKTFEEYLDEEPSDNPLKKLWNRVRHPIEFFRYQFGLRYKEEMKLYQLSKRVGGKLKERAEGMVEKATDTRERIHDATRTKEFIYTKEVLSTQTKNLSKNLKHLFTRLRTGEIKSMAELTKLKGDALREPVKMIESVIKKNPEHAAKIAPKLGFITKIGAKKMIAFSIGQHMFDWMRDKDSFEAKHAALETSKIIPVWGTLLEGYEAIRDNGQMDLAEKKKKWASVGISLGIDVATLATGGWAAIARLAKAPKAIKAIKGARAINKARILKGGKVAATQTVKGFGISSLVGVSFAAIYSQLFPEGKIMEIGTNLALNQLSPEQRRLVEMSGKF
ncbi:MAG: hypothetical protein OEL89_02450 [Candidatus Peregrinibacteria bacterium]|nr:hypothetical protein [Candidatus Peregrinibacteria bacterium]